MLYRDGCQCRGGDVTKRLTARQSGCLRHKKILADSGSVVRRGHDMSLTLQYEYNIFFFYLNLHCFLCFLNLQGLSNAGQLKETQLVQRVSVATTILKRLLCITVLIRSACVYDKQFLSCKTDAMCDFVFFFLSLSLGDKNYFLSNQSTIGFIYFFTGRRILSCAVVS